MDKKTWTIGKLNLRTIDAAYGVSIGIFLALAISSTINFIIFNEHAGNGSDISPANALWLLPLIAGIIIPANNFRRIINLGAKRDDFIWGSLITYVILAASVSLVVTVMNFTIEPWAERHDYYNPDFLGGIANLTEVFGWASRGAIVTFIQQFAFLFLLGAFFHTWTTMQGKWYGWVANVLIVAIISVFLPIPILRRALSWFFRLILHHQHSFVQIGACLVLGFGIYMLSKPILAKRGL